MKSFGGNVLFLDRSDINTDEIIPAKYLTEVSKEALRSHCLEDLKLENSQSSKDLTNKGVIVTRSNFGCGSSREHAPWALEVNGIQVVIAQSFARIFRQNMFNCGMLAIELSASTIDEIFSNFSKAIVSVDLNAMTLEVQEDEKKSLIPFSVSPFDLALVKAGGWVEYADAKY